MKRILIALIAVVMLALFAGNMESQPVLAAGLADNAANYIVVFKDQVADHPGKTARFERLHNFVSSHRYGAALKGFAARLTPAQAMALRADADIAFLSLDREYSIIGTVPVVSGDSVPTGVRRISAGTTTTAHQASNVNVAVIDTGVDLTHPDLNAVNGTNCISPGNPANDDHGHGSHVSGTIAAKNTGSGVVGVAPGTKIYAVKVLNSAGSGTSAQVICGIDWVAANAAALNIKVANMSLGGSGSNDNNCGNSNGDAEHKAICNAVSQGVTFVVAAGNSAVNFSSQTPAAYPEVLTVTAVSDSDGQSGGTGGAPACRTGELDDKYASFSNYASSTSSAAQNHTIAGPGVCIYSTWLGGGYNTISGTSMATPHVVGVVALCIGNGGAAGPCNGLTPAQIIAKLRADAQAHATSSNGFTGDPLHSVKRKYFGYMVYAGGY